MALNYPPVVVLSSHFRLTGGHNLNPTAQTLLAEDQQLFSTFNQLAVQVMVSAGLGADLLPVVVLLASMAPGVSNLQRVQLAVFFVRNAMAALNNATPTLSALVLPEKPRAARAVRARSPKQSSAQRTKAGRTKGQARRSRAPRT